MRRDVWTLIEMCQNGVFSRQLNNVIRGQGLANQELTLWA
jgi:hypothetical protein